MSRIVSCIWAEESDGMILLSFQLLHPVLKHIHLYTIGWGNCRFLLQLREL